MKFEKLNFDAFAKECLKDNVLRSIHGGAEIKTCNEDCEDIVYADGSTEWCNGECEERDFHDK